MSQLQIELCLGNVREHQLNQSLGYLKSHPLLTLQCSPSPGRGNGLAGFRVLHLLKSSYACSGVRVAVLTPT